MLDAGVANKNKHARRYAVARATARDKAAVARCRDLVDGLMGRYLQVGMCRMCANVPQHLPSLPPHAGCLPGSLCGGMLRQPDAAQLTASHVPPTCCTLRSSTSATGRCARSLMPSSTRSRSWRWVTLLFAGWVDGAHGPLRQADAQEAGGSMLVCGSVVYARGGL